MRIPLTYGLGIAFAMSVVSLVSHLAGFSTDIGKMLVGMLAGLVCLFASYIGGIVLGTRRARAEAGEAGFGYGQAFATGLLIVVFSALGGLVFNFIYFTLLSPDFAEIQAAGMQAMMERMNMPADKIDEAVEQMRAKSTVSRQPTSGFVTSIVFGTLVALIVAAFVRRPAADAPENLPPAFT